jgi:hypothetical protein
MKTKIIKKQKEYRNCGLNFVTANPAQELLFPSVLQNRCIGADERVP